MSGTVEAQERYAAHERRRLKLETKLESLRKSLIDTERDLEAELQIGRELQQVRVKFGVLGLLRRA